MKPMELKNYTDVTIFMVPLLDDNITLDDISTESGYIGAYTEDKNRPYLEDKVFLLYDNSINTEKSLNRYLKFKQLDTLYNTRSILLNNKSYTMYCFSNPKYIKDIRNLSKIGKTATVNAALEISRFWQNVPLPELSNRLFLHYYRRGESINAVSPEEDYYGYLDIGESE